MYFCRCGFIVNTKYLLTNMFILRTFFQYEKYHSCSINKSISKNHFTVRHIPELVESANEHLAVACPDLNLRVRCEDAQKLQVMRKFHIIHCGAAVEKVPDWMMDLLTVNGSLVVPVGKRDAPQVLTKFVKVAEPYGFQQFPLIDVLYVPLTSSEDQRVRNEHWDVVVEDCQQNSYQFFKSREVEENENDNPNIVTGVKTFVGRLAERFGF